MQALSTSISLSVMILTWDVPLSHINRICSISQLVRHFSSDPDKVRHHCLLEFDKSKFIVHQFREITIQMSKKNSEPSTLDKIRVPFLRHFRQSVSEANGLGNFYGLVESHINGEGLVCAGYKEDNKNKLYEETLDYPIDEVLFTLHFTLHQLMKQS
jgi:hypothetical protein